MTTTNEKKSSWPWSWKKEEELVWGQLIRSKYGQITLLDRKIHNYVITNCKYDKTISSEDFSRGMRRRLLAEPVSEDIQTVVTENKLNPLKVTFHCNVCNVVSTMRCGGCSAVFYCGRGHQKSDWKAHKSDCKIFKEKKEIYFAPQEEENYEGYINGFSPDDCEELLSQGVKPWDDDASAVLSVLYGRDDDADWNINDEDDDDSKDGDENNVDDDDEDDVEDDDAH